MSTNGTGTTIYCAMYIQRNAARSKVVLMLTLPLPALCTAWRPDGPDANASFVYLVHCMASSDGPDAHASLACLVHCMASSDGPDAHAFLACLARYVWRPDDGRGMGCWRSPQLPSGSVPSRCPDRALPGRIGPHDGGLPGQPG
eukprot:scaffold214399_cov20-Tisochrysis_lutea.AAC.1